MNESFDRLQSITPSFIVGDPAPKITFNPATDRGPCPLLHCVVSGHNPKIELHGLQSQLATVGQVSASKIHLCKGRTLIEFEIQSVDGPLALTIYLDDMPPVAAA